MLGSVAAQQNLIALGIYSERSGSGQAQAANYREYQASIAIDIPPHEVAAKQKHFDSGIITDDFLQGCGGSH